GMWCMCSTPPAICTSSHPAAMLMAAWWTACSEEPHRRLTVQAAVSTGRPARRGGMRPTFEPCSACGVTQPQWTGPAEVGGEVGARQQGVEDVGGEVVGADVAEIALLGVGLADGRADGFDDDGGAHERGPFRGERRARASQKHCTRGRDYCLSSSGG